MRLYIKSFLNKQFYIRYFVFKLDCNCNKLKIYYYSLAILLLDMITYTFQVFLRGIVTPFANIFN